jgi:hypothetical protein
MSDFTNLLEKLRSEHNDPWQVNPAAKIAADAIEWLVKEINNLREMSVAEEVLANQIRKEIREDERERCAKIAEQFLSNNEPVRLTASSIAAAIRERSNGTI